MKVKVVLSIISNKRKMPRQIIRSDGIFSEKMSSIFLKNLKKVPK